MSTRIAVDYSALLPFVTEEALASSEGSVLEALRTLERGEGPGAEYRGWISYPESVPEGDLRMLRAGRVHAISS